MAKHPFRSDGLEQQLTISSRGTSNMDTEGKQCSVAVQKDLDKTERTAQESAFRRSFRSWREARSAPLHELAVFEARRIELTASIRRPLYFS